MYKNIYINGCSFTAGHFLEDKDTWPYLLADSLDLNLINKAVNSNSMGTITDTTIRDLLKLNSKETLVVIGLTWPDRQSIYYDNALFNFTIGDVESIRAKQERNWSRVLLNKLGEKKITSTDKKISEEDIRKKLIIPNIDDFKYPEIEKPFYDTAMSFKNYFKTWAINDEFFVRSTNIKYLLNLINLQNFFKVNKFNYIFVRFQGLYQTLENKAHPTPVLVEEIDRTKMISFRDEKQDPDRIENCDITYFKSHPDKNSTPKIANAIAKTLNTLYL